MPGERLGQRPVGAQRLRQIEIILRIGLSPAGDGQDFQIGIILAQRDDGFDSFLIRHDQIGDHQIGPLGAAHRAAFAAVAGGAHIVSGAAKHFAKHPPNLLFVVNDQNRRHLEKSWWKLPLARNESKHAAIAAANDIRQACANGRLSHLSLRRYFIARRPVFQAKIAFRRIRLPAGWRSRHASLFSHARFYSGPIRQKGSAEPHRDFRFSFLGVSSMALLRRALQPALTFRCLLAAC
ncbi:MAG: hypothetical protein BWZ10_02708 [candidate division BRC1 bacterium ADurb.BinA364]|nr:MAG: hypothetical protein BWZ10_02708 [candidate division BRC1 bacterium ADurb.BinA364]